MDFVGTFVAASTRGRGTVWAEVLPGVGSIAAGSTTTATATGSGGRERGEGWHARRSPARRV